LTKNLGGKSLNKGRKSDNFFPTFPCFLTLPPSLKRGDTGGGDEPLPALPKFLTPLFCKEGLGEIFKIIKIYEKIYTEIKSSPTFLLLQPSA
jgi:hypothetical protein